MRWRLTYVIRSHGITEDEPLWTDNAHVWNMDGVESDADAAEKAKTFLENIVRQNGSLQKYELVRIVQEEVTVAVQIPALKSYSDLKWPKEPKVCQSHKCGICGAEYPTVQALYAHQQRSHDPDGIMFSEIGLPK